MHCASVSAVVITSVFYSFLVRSERLSNSLRFLFLLDNLCYSCTCLAPPRLAFHSYLRGKPSNFCIFVERIKLLFSISIIDPLEPIEYFL